MSPLSTGKRKMTRLSRNSYQWRRGLKSALQLQPCLLGFPSDPPLASPPSPASPSVFSCTWYLRGWLGPFQGLLSFPGPLPWEPEVPLLVNSFVFFLFIVMMEGLEPRNVKGQLCFLLCETLVQNLKYTCEFFPEGTPKRAFS